MHSLGVVQAPPARAIAQFVATLPDQAWSAKPASWEVREDSLSPVGRGHLHSAKVFASLAADFKASF